MAGFSESVSESSVFIHKNLFVSSTFEPQSAFRSLHPVVVSYLFAINAK
jgi:hypothetical protein